MLLINKYLSARHEIIVACILILAAVPFLWSHGQNVYDEDIVNIGSRLELFVDSFLIEKQENVCRILHQPEDAGNVLFFDKPWEGPFCGYATIIKDDEVYRLYYRGLPEAGKDGSSMETTCYAVSGDGINWTRPD